MCSTRRGTGSRTPSSRRRPGLASSTNTFRAQTSGAPSPTSRSPEPMPPNPQDALLDEFAAYYTADELPGFIDDHLLEHGDDSAARLVHILDDGAAELPGLL